MTGPSYEDLSDRADELAAAAAEAISQLAPWQREIIRDAIAAIEFAPAWATPAEVQAYGDRAEALIVAAFAKIRGEDIGANQ